MGEGMETKDWEFGKGRDNSFADDFSRTPAHKGSDSSSSRHNKCRSCLRSKEGEKGILCPQQKKIDEVAVEYSVG